MNERKLNARDLKSPKAIDLESQNARARARAKEPVNKLELRSLVKRKGPVHQYL